MAELKSLGRKINQPNAPDISGASQASSSLGQTLQEATLTAGQIYDSYNKSKAEMLYSDTADVLNKELVGSLSRENIAQGNAYKRYMEKAEAITEGTLSSVPRKYQSDVKRLLSSQINKMGLKVATTEYSFLEEQNKVQARVNLETYYKQLQEASNTGDLEGVDVLEATIDSSINNRLAVGDFDDYDAYKAREKVKEIKVQADYTDTYSRLLREDPAKAYVYLKEFSENKPDNLSYNEWKSVQANLYSLTTEYDKMANYAQSLGMSEFKRDFDSSLIQTPEALSQWIDSKESEGRYFSPIDKNNMYDALARQKEGGSKKQAAIIEVAKAVAESSPRIYDMPKKAINDWYVEQSNFLEQSYIDNGQGGPDRLDIRASVAASVPVKIESFNNEFSTKLMHGNFEDFEQALKTGEHLLETSPKTYAYFDKQTQAYHDLASNLYGNSKLNIQQIKDLTDKAVAPKDSATQEKIDKGLADIHKGSYLKNLYKQIYGQKFVNPALQPEYNSMVKAYDAFYQITGDQENAQRLTETNMNVRSGESKYVPKNTITKNPIEKTPLYQNHEQFAKNQMALGLELIVQNQEEQRAKGLNPKPKIEWPDGIERPNYAEMTDEDFYSKPFFVPKPGGKIMERGKSHELTLKIDGKNRRVYLLNPNTNLDDDSADQREYHYADEFGNPNAIFIAKEQDKGNGVVRSESGIATLELMAPEQLVPKVAAKRADKATQELAQRHLQEEFRAKNKKPLFRGKEEQIGVMRGEVAHDDAQLKKAEDDYVRQYLPEKVNEITAYHKKQAQKLIGENK